MLMTLWFTLKLLIVPLILPLVHCPEPNQQFYNVTKYIHPSTDLMCSFEVIVLRYFVRISKTSLVVH